MVAVLAAISLVVLIGAAALAVDGGALLTERRHAQETADAAALAAAADLFQNYPVNNGFDSGGTAAASAQTVATANGYTNDGTTNTVTVNIPPKSGNFTNAAKYPGYAEVIVTYNQARTLSGVFGSGTMPVRGRAVARGQWVPAQPQIIVFDLAAPTALDLVTSNITVTVSTGAVVVNSSSAIAASNADNANFTAPLYDVTGGMVGTFSGPADLGVRPTPDPLSYLPAPDTTKLTTQSASAVTYNAANPPPVGGLQPGIYVGGVTINGVSATLNPGVYYFQGGGFTFKGFGTLTGINVLLYNAPATINDVISISGARPLIGNSPPPATVTLSPLPNSGQWQAYQGLVIFQNQAATAPIILNGTGNYNITGTIYAANAACAITCRKNQTTNQSDVIGSQYMTRTISFNGTGNLLMTQVAPQPRQRIIGLVE